MNEPSRIVLAIVRLSDSFREVWTPLAAQFGIPVEPWTAAPGAAPPVGAAAIVVAAGGQETELPALLASLAVPADVPVIAVGASISHRVGAQAVAAGAADYFALPEDRDGLRDALGAAIDRRRAALDRASFGDERCILIHTCQRLCESQLRGARGGLMARTAQLGGQIHHEEIRAALAPGTSLQQGEPAEER